MPKAKKVEEKKPLISINTEEPLEDEKIELIPGIVGGDEDKEDDDEDDDLKIDDEEVNPFGDRWEQ